MSPQPPQRPDDDPGPKPVSEVNVPKSADVKALKEQPEKVKADKEFEKLKPEKEGKLEAKEIEKAKSDKELEKVKSDKELEKVKSDKEFEKAKSDKEFEKAKSDKEFEKVKADKELEKLKPEKESKLEAKEFEKVKRDDEKPLEKLDKELNEGGGPGAAAVNPAEGLDTAELLRHADSLEESGRRLRHFIEQSLRPDLGEGALRNEDDLQPDDGDA
jgi:hypothetical protein